jgi:competence transcription factor ComK
VRRSNHTQPYTNALVICTVSSTQKRNIFIAGTNSASYYMSKNRTKRIKFPKKERMIFDLSETE